MDKFRFKEFYLKKIVEKFVFVKRNVITNTILPWQCDKREAFDNFLMEMWWVTIGPDLLSASDRLLTDDCRDSECTENYG